MGRKTEIKMECPEQLGFLDDHAHFFFSRHVHHVDPQDHFSLAGHQGQHPSVGESPGLYPSFSTDLPARAIVLWFYSGTIPVLLGKRKEVGEFFDETFQAGLKT